MRVGLLTPYMGWNLGDTAIVEAALAGLRLADPDLSATMICLDPVRVSRLHGVPALPIGAVSRPFYPIKRVGQPVATTESRPLDQPRRLAGLGKGIRRGIAAIPGARRVVSLLETLALEASHARSAWRTVRSLDLLLISGGGQLDDDFGGPWGHPYALAKWLGFARLAGTPTAMCSVGSGLARSRISRWLLSLAIRWTGEISIRDGQSLSALGLARPGLPYKVLPDLAFSTPPARAASRAEQPERPRIGISPIAFSKPGSWPTSAAGVFDRYFQELVTFSESLLARGYELHLFGTDGGDAEVVRALRDALQARHPAPGSVESHGVPDLARYMELVAGLDFVVASRLHGVILPHVQGRPVLAISYQRKVVAHMQDMGMTAAVLPIEDVSAPRLLQLFDELYSKRAGLSRDIEDRVATRRSALVGHLAQLVERVGPERTPRARVAEARQG